LLDRLPPHHLSGRRPGAETAVASRGQNLYQTRCYDDDGTVRRIAIVYEHYVTCVCVCFKCFIWDTPSHLF